MIYHIFGNSPYTKKFIDFLISNRSNFGLENHYFLIHSPKGSAFDIPDIKNCNYKISSNSWWFIQAFKYLKKNDKIIIHQLANPRLLLYLFFNRKYIKQCRWSIWGGDVYFFRNRKNNIKTRCIEHLRKSIIPRIPVISSFIKGDFEVVQSVYSSKARYIFAFYPNPIDYNLINKYKNIKKDNYEITFLVGNSGNPENNQCEILDILSKFKNENIKIIVPLSYGEKPHIDFVKCYGKKLFGDKFVALTEFLPPEKYIQLLAGVDVAIMNHNYQQALGNIIAIIALGKKVYLKKEATPYQFFKMNGIKVYNSDELSKQNFKEIIQFSSEISRTNELNQQLLLSLDKNISGWQEMFE